MISKKELKEFLLKSCVNEYGELDLSDLDFSDFCGDITFNGLKAKRNVDVGCMDVGGDLYQCDQHVHGNLIQDNQVVGGDITQNNQSVGGDLFQGFQTVGRDLYLGTNSVSGKIIQENLDNEDDSKKNNY